jgi:hypothetical protein
MAMDVGESFLEDPEQRHEDHDRKIVGLRHRADSGFDPAPALEALAEDAQRSLMLWLSSTGGRSK